MSPNGEMFTHTARGARSGSTPWPLVPRTTSAVASSSSRAGSSTARHTISLRAVQAAWRKGWRRSGSPVGRSTRVTWAPRSARIRAASAPLSSVRSTTSMPSSTGDSYHARPSEPDTRVRYAGAGMGTYDLVSADAHILEPPGIWERWLPERFQDRGPQLGEDREGGSAWLIPGAAEPDPIGLTAPPGMPWHQFRWKGVTYDEARPGCYD